MVPAFARRFGDGLPISQNLDGDINCWLLLKQGVLNSYGVYLFLLVFVRGEEFHVEPIVHSFPIDEFGPSERNITCFGEINIS